MYEVSHNVYEDFLRSESHEFAIGKRNSVFTLLQSDPSCFLSEASVNASITSTSTYKDADTFKHASTSISIELKKVPHHLGDTFTHEDSTVDHPSVAVSIDSVQVYPDDEYNNSLVSCLIAKPVFQSDELKPKKNHVDEIDKIIIILIVI